MPTSANELLTSDHAELNALLRQIKVGIDAEDQEEAFRDIDLFWARLAMHIRAEHLHLFPAIIAFCEGIQSPQLASVPNTIMRLRSDHDLFMHELAQIVKSLRPLGAAIDSKLFTDILSKMHKIEALLSEHNAIEENEIYPLAKQFLGDQEYINLITSLHHELNNMPARFKG